MQTENLSTLKIHKLSQEQYEREVNNGTIDAQAIYLTPDSNDSASFDDYVFITTAEIDAICSASVIAEEADV